MALLLVAAIFAPATLAGAPVARSYHTACHTSTCRERVARKHRRRVVRPYRPWLRRLRQCESTNNYRAVSPGGTYTGAYQFDARTWRSVGGRAIARHAGPLEQDYRAVILRKRRGTAPWPTCGRN